MVKIVEKRQLTPITKLYRVYAPLIAKAARAGQFVIVRVREGGERIPLTITDYDRDSGLLTIVVQEVGATTRRLGELQQGEEILDMVGPLVSLAFPERIAQRRSEPGSFLLASGAGVSIPTSDR